MSDNHFYSSKGLAVRWGLNENTLRQWRMRGHGPRFVRIGRSIRYPASAVRQYEERN